MMSYHIFSPFYPVLGFNTEPIPSKYPAPPLQSPPPPKCATGPRGGLGDRQPPTEY